MVSSPDCPVGQTPYGDRACDGPGTYYCDDMVWGSRCRAWQARNGGFNAPAGVETSTPTPAEQLAQAFHAAYEDLAPEYGYRTREESAVPWRRVPVRNRRLMIATAQRLLVTRDAAAQLAELMTVVTSYMLGDVDGAAVAEVQQRIRAAGVQL